MKTDNSMIVQRIQPDLIKITVRIGDETIDHLVRVGPGDDDDFTRQKTAPSTVQDTNEITPVGAAVLR